MLNPAVKQMIASIGYKMIVVYLDDFLIIAPSFAQCMEACKCLLELLCKLSFEISWKKVVAPTQCLTFPGVQIDSVGQCLSLPQDKLVELRAFVCKHSCIGSGVVRGNYTYWLGSSSTGLAGLSMGVGPYVAF